MNASVEFVCVCGVEVDEKWNISWKKITYQQEVFYLSEVEKLKVENYFIKNFP